MSETFHYQSTFGAKTPWGDTVTWREGEKPIFWVTEAHILGSLGREPTHKDILILTNERILCVNQQGMSPGLPGVLMQVNLEDVLLATRADYGPLRIIERGRGSIEIESTDNEGLENAPRMINEAVSTRKAELRTLLEKEVAVVGLDFPRLMNILQGAGIVVGKLMCHSCGSQIDVPKTGGSAECEYCGRIVYARETVTRLKEATY
ncbi:MAG: hypothetical protein OK438_00440 [Thaumarchaeota archaeon]|nr:hypothetical protein [Nitrososphaerota archaeon]